MPVDPLDPNTLLMESDDVYDEDDVNTILHFVDTYCPAHGIRVEVTTDWAEAVRRVRAHYPEDVFPWPSETTDGKAAMMARLTCDNVSREAARIARERVDERAG